MTAEAHIDICRRFGPFNGGNTDASRWGAFVHVKGWAYALYGGGTAYCKECADSDEADRLYKYLYHGLIGHHDIMESEFDSIKLCFTGGWKSLHYLGGMNMLVDGEWMELPIPDCEY